MPSANEAVVDATFDFALKLDRFVGGTAHSVDSLVVELQNEIRGILAESDPLTELTRSERRARALFRQLDASTKSTYGTTELRSERNYEELSRISARGGAEAINAGFRVDIANPRLTPADVQALTSNVLVDSKPTSKWWEGQDANLRQAYRSQIRQGVSLGESNQKIINRIIGKRTGYRTIVGKDGKKSRVGVYSGGIMDISRQDADALVRTSALSVSNGALQKTYEKNKSLLKGMGALVTLDARTTPICMSRAGMVWSMTGDPLPGSPRTEGYPGPPPWHWRCRSTIVPITKSWNELRAEAGKGKLTAKQSRTLNTVPDAWRQSMDGRVPGSHNYESWLRTKDAAFQREKLGTARYRLWKDGKISLAQLTENVTGRTLTIDELNRLVARKKKN